MINQKKHKKYVTETIEAQEYHNNSTTKYIPSSSVSLLDYSPSHFLPSDFFWGGEGVTSLMWHYM